jgi:hypothetical protein
MTEQELATRRPEGSSDIPIFAGDEHELIDEKLAFEVMVEEIEAAFSSGDIHRAALFVEMFEDEYPNKSLGRIIEKRRTAKQTESNKASVPAPETEMSPEVRLQAETNLAVIDDVYASGDYRDAPFWEHVFALMYSEQLMLDMRAARKSARQWPPRGPEPKS